MSRRERCKLPWLRNGAEFEKERGTGGGEGGDGEGESLGRKGEEEKNVQEGRKKEKRKEKKGNKTLKEEKQKKEEDQEERERGERRRRRRGERLEDSRQSVYEGALQTAPSPRPEPRDSLAEFKCLNYAPGSQVCQSAGSSAPPALAANAHAHAAATLASLFALLFARLRLP